MSTLKVKRKVTPKVPWYEKPPLLFGSIAALLIISGFVMAQINSRVSQPPAEVAEVDSVAVAVGDSISARWQLTAGLLGADEVLPEPAPGEILPPVLVQTLRDAALVREKLRVVRGDDYAFAAARNWLTLGDAATWEALERKPDFEPRKDFEFHRARSGEIYVAAFVSRAVAEAFIALGPRLALREAPPENHPPAWQFWKRDDEESELKLYRDSAIDLYPDLNPEATCFVVLPLARLSPQEAREMRLGRGLPSVVLTAVLH